MAVLSSRRSAKGQFLPSPTKTGKKPPRRPRIEETNPAMPGVVAEAFSKTGTYAGAAEVTGLMDKTVKGILLRNPEALTEARKKLGNKALEVSAAFLDRAMATVKAAKGTSAAIGAKVLGQMALEQHDLMPSLVTVNLAVLSQSGEALEKLARETEQIRAMLAKPAQVEPTLAVVDATVLEAEVVTNNLMSNAMPVDIVADDKSLEK